MAEFLSRKWCDTQYSNMLRRVRTLGEYKDCQIAPEWEDYQVFYSWVRANAVEGWVLDKDILIEGNRVYGPSTCVYVPEPLNLVFKRPRGLTQNLHPNVTRTKHNAFYVRVGHRDSQFRASFNSLTEANLVAQRESLRYKYHVAMSYRNDTRLTAVIDVLIERLKNQATQLRPILVTHNLL